MESLIRGTKNGDGGGRLFDFTLERIGKNKKGGEMVGG